MFTWTSAIHIFFPVMCLKTALRVIIFSDISIATSSNHFTLTEVKYHYLQSSNLSWFSPVSSPFYFCNPHCSLPSCSDFLSCLFRVPCFYPIDFMGRIISSFSFTFSSSFTFSFPFLKSISYQRRLLCFLLVMRSGNGPKWVRWKFHPVHYPTSEYPVKDTSGKRKNTWTILLLIYPLGFQNTKTRDTWLRNTVFVFNNFFKFCYLNLIFLGLSILL